MSNLCTSRLSQLGRTMTFGELHNGDVFIPAGFHNSGVDSQFRKMSSTKAFAIQDFTTKEFPADWPVVLVDTVMDAPSMTAAEHNAFPKGRWN